MSNTLDKPLKSYSGMLITVAIAALIIAGVAFFVTKKSDQAPKTEPAQTQPISNPAADGAAAPTSGGAPDNKNPDASTTETK